jgi:hypothetical protein
MLGKLCLVYGWTLSRLVAEAETHSVNLVLAAKQTEWKDPESGYRRRAVSAPAPGRVGELVEVRIPVGAYGFMRYIALAGIGASSVDPLNLDVEGSGYRLHGG